MSTGRHFSINGGDLRGAHFGDEHGTQNHYRFDDGSRALVLLDAVRATLDDERAARIVGLGRTHDERTALAREVAGTRRALAAERPDGGLVRARWDAVLAVLGTALAMNADVAQITQFIMDLFSP